MIWLAWICLLFATAVIVLGLRLLWAWRRLRTHPHVEPIEIAHPSIAHEMQQMVAEIAEIAGVAPPPVFIRRAALPNAFVMVSITRPELYLTDELLEQCSSLEELKRIICHEIAHIKRGDAIPLGLLTLATQWGRKLAIASLANFFDKRIANIEHAADLEARTIFRAMKTTPPTGDPCEL